MIQITSIADMHAARRSLTGSVGLVPTMGYLHAGHIALATRARALGAITRAGSRCLGHTVHTAGFPNGSGTVRAERGPHRRDLRHHVDTVAVLLDHARDTAHLPLDEVQPLQA